MNYLPGDIVRHTAQMERHFAGAIEVPINGAVLKTREFGGGQLLTVHWSDSTTGKILSANVEPCPRAVGHANRKENGLGRRLIEGTLEAVATMPVNQILLEDPVRPKRQTKGGGTGLRASR